LRQLSAFETRLVERIDQLIAKGPLPGQVSAQAFAEFKAQGLNLLIGTFGLGHIYTESFRNEVTVATNANVRAGQGILRGLRQDLIAGDLPDLRTLISAEVFSNFLEMAKHLLDTQYKDAAASLSGAVLEDGLRRIAEKVGISTKSGDDLSSLSQKLAAKSVYSSLVLKKLQVWIAVRNNADHAKWTEYTEQDVRDMHKGVSDFLAEYLR